MLGEMSPRLELTILNLYVRRDVPQVRAGECRYKGSLAGEVARVHVPLKHLQQDKAVSVESS